MALSIILIIILLSIETYLLVQATNCIALMNERINLLDERIDILQELISLRKEGKQVTE
jgi:hypothetical protein